MGARVSVTDSRRRSFRDRLLSAFHSRDESSFHDELEKLAQVPELLGEQVSGEGSGGEGRTGDTHVSINLSGGGAPSVSSGPGPVGDQPEPMEGGQPEAAGGGLMQQILQRLDRIEQAIVVLAQGEGGEDPMSTGEEEDRMLGDRRTSDRRTTDRRIKDQEGPTEPPTEEPMEDPGQSLPYGAGTTNVKFDDPQLGTEDRKTGTRDRRHTTGDEQGKRQNFIGDSTSMQMEFQDTISRAALLVPNLRVPTFDAKAPAKTTYDTICSLRRNVLQEAYRDGEKHSYIDVLLAGKPANFPQMTCDAVATVFYGASELARQANNNSFGRIRPNNEGVRGGGRALSPADINARNREKYHIN